MTTTTHEDRSSPVQRALARSRTITGSVDLTGSPSPKKEHQGKEWCLTIHYRTSMAIGTTDAVALSQEKRMERSVATYFIDKINEDATYSIFGDETCPKTHQQHFQGYVIFKHRQRLSTLRKKYQKTIHWEAAKGNHVENIAYCSKEDENPLTFGKEPEFTDNGEREKSRWKKARINATKGKFDEIDDQIYVQNYSNLLKIHQSSVCDTSVLTQMPGHWLYGVSGSGKTYKARTGFPGRVYLKGLNKWWCGYSGEENVVIEDMDMSHAFLLYYIKIWIDIWPFPAEVKNGSVKQIRPKRIIITSNHAIKDIFKCSDILSGEDQVAVMRRFNVEHFPYVHADCKAKLSEIVHWDPKLAPIAFNLFVPETPAPNPDNSVFKAADYITPATIDKSDIEPTLTIPGPHVEAVEATQPMSDDEEENEV